MTMINFIVVRPNSQIHSVTKLCLPLIELTAKIVSMKFLEYSVVNMQLVSSGKFSGCYHSAPHLGYPESESSSFETTHSASGDIRHTAVPHYLLALV